MRPHSAPARVHRPAPWPQLAFLFALALAALIPSATTALPERVPADVTPADLPVRIEPVPLLEVELKDPADAARLRALDVDRLDAGGGRAAQVLAWPGTAERLSAGGLRFRIVESDFGGALARAAGIPAGAQPEPLAPASAPPLGSGSMGGYHTLAEIDAFLADLVANDPHGIVGPVVPIGLSRQGRPIQAVRIGREAFPDDSRPRVLFTALHHAREPIGMQVVLEFMRRLVTEYGTDPNLTYLVDRREIWFLPVVNPDGYNLNQTTFFGSGSFGLWRKNARDNDGSGTITNNDGVDLNRNYSYRWGYDNAGSSPLTSSLEYRGPSAFSEPETKAVRDFCLAHQFVTANNYHTYGELCLYPWGYNGVGAPDSTFFKRMTDEMTRDLSYACGVGADVLYATNGDANDWMYGEQTTKPKCFAVTTEVGDRNDNFWPPAGRIPVLADAQFRSNVMLAYAAGPSVWSESAAIESWDGWLHPGGSCRVSVTLRNQGAEATTGAITVSASCAVPGITVTDPVCTYGALAPGAAAGPIGDDRIGVSAAIPLPPGTLVPLVLTITDQGTYVARDTTTILVGVPQVLLAEDADQGTGQWVISSRWGIQTLAGDPQFADSPTGLYTTQADARLTAVAPVDLTGAAHAWLRFRSTWDIEVGADCGRVEVSIDGGANWSAVGGRLTRAGHGQTGAYVTGTQPAGVPVYDGTQRIEEEELMDLTPWCGHPDVRLRFHFTSDENGRRQGWFVDDIRLLAYPDLATGVPESGNPVPDPELLAAAPNPFSASTRFFVRFPSPTRFRARVFGPDGRLVATLAEGVAAAGTRALTWDGRRADGTEAVSGTYFVRIEWTGGTASRRVVLVR